MSEKDKTSWKRVLFPMVKVLLVACNDCLVSKQHKVFFTNSLKERKILLIWSI